jgi:hypothetical protein
MEREKEGERERERGRESVCGRTWLFLFLKGMTGALALLSYLALIIYFIKVNKNNLECKVNSIKSD